MNAIQLIVIFVRILCEKLFVILLLVVRRTKDRSLIHMIIATQKLKIGSIMILLKYHCLIWNKLFCRYWSSVIFFCRYRKKFQPYYFFMWKKNHFLQEVKKTEASQHLEFLPFFSCIFHSAPIADFKFYRFFNHSCQYSYKNQINRL